MRILLLAQKTVYSEIIIRKFCEIKDIEISGLIFSDALFNNKTKIESLKMIIKKGGLGILLEKAIESIFSYSFSNNYGFPVLNTNSINSKKTIEIIKGLRPDLIFSIYFNQIIKEELLTIPSYGLVNIHPSYLPGYRGVGPTFWVLSNNEKETGVTYHFITLGIDDGNIIKQTKIPIDNLDSVYSLYFKLSRTAAEMLPSVLETISHNKKIEDRQNESLATYFGIPDRKGYRKLKENNRCFITYKDMANRISIITKK